MPVVQIIGRSAPVQSGESDRGQDVIIIAHPACGLPNEAGAVSVDAARAEPALVPSHNLDAWKLLNFLDARP